MSKFESSTAATESSTAVAVPACIRSALEMKGLSPGLVT